MDSAWNLKRLRVRDQRWNLSIAGNGSGAGLVVCQQRGEMDMANERIPNDLYPNDPYRAPMTDGEYPRTQRFDTELQADPELAEGPSSTGRIAAYAVGIAILLGAVFYGLSHSSSPNQASTPPTTRAAQTQPAAPANNNAPGVTTGAATNRPTPPASAPTGTELDRSAPPPTGKNNNTN
jgi:hypothetical protein